MTHIVTKVKVSFYSPLVISPIHASFLSYHPVSMTNEKCCTNLWHDQKPTNNKNNNNNSDNNNNNKSDNNNNNNIVIRKLVFTCLTNLASAPARFLWSSHQGWRRRICNINNTNFHSLQPTFKWILISCGKKFYRQFKCRAYRFGVQVLAVKSLFWHHDPNPTPLC